MIGREVAVADHLVDEVATRVARGLEPHDQPAPLGGDARQRAPAPVHDGPTVVPREARQREGPPVQPLERAEVRAEADVSVAAPAALAVHHEPDLTERTRAIPPHHAHPTPW